MKPVHERTTSKRRGNVGWWVPSVGGHRLGGLARASVREGTWSNKIHGKCFTSVAWGPCVLCGQGEREREKTSTNSVSGGQ